MRGEFLGGKGVVDRDCFLVDDRPFVEIWGDKMGSGADYFYSPLIGLEVRVCPFKGGEERVVDIDDFAWVGITKFGGEDLHIAGKDDIVNFIFRDNCFELSLLRVFSVRGNA